MPTVEIQVEQQANRLEMIRWNAISEVPGLDDDFSSR